MPSQQDARRSTSALLYDENDKEREAILENQPLLRYEDSESLGQGEPSRGRIYARYGLFRFIY